MRFESLLWTVLTLFLVGGAALETDTLGAAPATETRYESKDGEVRIPPPAMDPGSTATAPTLLTK